MANDCAVYIAGADGWGFIKVGVTRNGNGRLLNLQTGCPVEIRILSMREGLSAEHAADIETAIHLLLADYHSKGEWFSTTAEHVRDILHRFKLSPKTPKRKLTGQEQTAAARKAAFIKGTRGGRPPALTLKGADLAEFKRMWRDGAVDREMIARRFGCSVATVVRRAGDLKLGAKA